MTRQLMKATWVFSLPLALALAAPPSHAGIWRSSEPQAPAKKASTPGKQSTTARHVSGSKAPAPSKTLAGTKLATSAKPVASAKPAPTTRAASTTKGSATAKGGAPVAHAETSIGPDGNVVYHSISDWQPGSLNRQNTRPSSATSRGGSRTSGGKSHERAVEVALSSLQP